MFKKILKFLASVCIILTVLFFTGRNLTSLLSESVTGSDSIFSVLRDQFCTQKVQIPDLDQNKKMVILRLDDVQAFSWSDISMKIVQDAYIFNAPIVMGVIPKWLYTDSILTQFLKRENCNIEIAIHGWDHFGKKSNTVPPYYITEFGDSTYAEARRRIQLGREILQPLSDEPLTTFIPPFNLISQEALDGIMDEGIKINSALWTWAYDYHSTTYNFDQKRIVTVEEVIKNCEWAFVQNGLCVIMMHPQDYAKPDKTLDTELYNKYYLELLGNLSKMDVVFVTFRDILKMNIRH
jgi:predicted deacetylase